MKYEKAMEIINGKPGYMVHFERIEGSCLSSDYFPDKHAGEDLIETEYEAWELARAFAQKTVGMCVNIYVIDSDFCPVESYKDNYIKNR